MYIFISVSEGIPECRTCCNDFHRCRQVCSQRKVWFFPSYNSCLLFLFRLPILLKTVVAVNLNLCQFYDWIYIYIYILSFLSTRRALRTHLASLTTFIEPNHLKFPFLYVCKNLYDHSRWILSYQMQLLVPARVRVIRNGSCATDKFSRLFYIVLVLRTVKENESAAANGPAKCAPYIYNCFQFFSNKKYATRFTASCAFLTHKVQYFRWISLCNIDSVEEQMYV